MESEHKGPVNKDHFDIREWLATHPVGWIDETSLRKLQELIIQEGAMITGTRKNVVNATNSMIDVLIAMEGIGQEMSDKMAALVMARAIWIALDWIVHHIDQTKEAPK